MSVQRSRSNDAWRTQRRAADRAAPARPRAPAVWSAAHYRERRRSAAPSCPTRRQTRKIAGDDGLALARQYRRDPERSPARTASVEKRRPCPPQLWANSDRGCSIAQSSNVGLGDDAFGRPRRCAFCLRLPATRRSAAAAMIGGEIPKHSASQAASTASLLRNLRSNRSRQKARPAPSISPQKAAKPRMIMAPRPVPLERRRRVRSAPAPTCRASCRWLRSQPLADCAAVSLAAA